MMEPHNFQSDKAIEAISSGGFFGKGIGEGTLKTRVPEAHTDYIVSVISEEFGVIAIIFLLILFLFFIYSVFKKIYLEKSEKIKLVLTGVISLIIFQALIHLWGEYKTISHNRNDIAISKLWGFFNCRSFYIIWHNFKFNKKKN